MSWRRQVLVRLAKMAAVLPPRGLPTKRLFFLLWKSCHNRNWTKPLRGIDVARSFVFRVRAIIWRLGPSEFLARAPLRKYGCAACSASRFPQGARHDKPSSTHDRGHA